MNSSVIAARSRAESPGLTGVHRERHVVEDTHPRQERVLLEDDAPLRPGSVTRAPSSVILPAFGASNPPINDITWSCRNPSNRR